MKGLFYIFACMRVLVCCLLWGMVLWAQPLSVDSVGLAAQRFGQNQDFYAVILLDKYLRAHPRMDLHFWRVWGEIQIDDLEGAQRHLLEIDPASECDQTRWRLFQMYANYMDQQQWNTLRQDYSTLRESSCVYQEDLTLQRWLRSVVYPEWDGLVNGRLP